ncbi:MAG TPA: hypothetical protein VGC07_10885 [Granulicella sp.]
MKQSACGTILLAVIAVALVAIALREYAVPISVQAQSALEHRFYVEPGVQMLRFPNGDGQVWGKIMVDLQTGQVWGFPTYATDPYPSPANLADKKPVTSHPFLLGKFALDEIDK